MSGSVEKRNETVTNLVTACLSRAKQAHQSYVEQVSKIVPVETGGSEDQLRSLNSARQDTEDNLDFALKLMAAADDAEVQALQGAYSRLETASSGSVLQSSSATSVAAPAECSIASASVAAVTAGGALQTMELDSSAIAAELEATVAVPEIDLPGLQAVESAQPAVSESDISAEIEALSARIHEAKARTHEPRAATDDEVAAAVAAAELLDAEVELPVVVAESAADAIGHQTVVTDGVEDSADVEAAAAELEHLLIADEDEVQTIEAAAVLEQALVATDTDTLAGEEMVVAGTRDDVVDVIRAPLPPIAEAIASDASAPAVVVLPSAMPSATTAEIEAALAASEVSATAMAGTPPIEAPVNVIANETTVGGKSFSLDLAAQLDAVRAMIRGSSIADTTKEAVRSVGK